MGALALAGLAMGAAGAATNFVEKKQMAKNAKNINRTAEGRIKQNQAEAAQRWQEALGKLSPEAQKEMMDRHAGERMDDYSAATANVPQDATVVNTEGAPAVVKTDAAKKLGDQLSKMQGRMQARSRLGAWDDRGLETGIDLGRSGQDINRLADFSRGTTLQQQRDVERAMQGGSGIGDMLQGMGSMMGMAGSAGSMMGAAGGAAGGATDAANTALPLTGTVYGPTPATPNFFERSMKSLTTPLFHF